MLVTSFLILAREEDEVLRSRVRGRRLSDNKGWTHEEGTDCAAEEERQER